MEHDRIEHIAEDVYITAGLDPDGSRTVLELADAYLGRGRRTAVFDAANLDAPATVRVIRGGPSLVVRSDLSDRQAEWFGAKALAQWVLGAKAALADVELLAACLRAPRPAVRAVAYDVGGDFAAVASALDLGETSALLRLGEALGRRVVVFSPPTPPKMRGRGRPLRWCRTKLSGAPGRYALLGS